MRIEEYCQKEEVLKEMINAKDETIMELTTRIDNLDKCVDIGVEDFVEEPKCTITINADELSYTELQVLIVFLYSRSSLVKLFSILSCYSKISS